MVWVLQPTALRGWHGGPAQSPGGRGRGIAHAPHDAAGEGPGPVRAVFWGVAGGGGAFSPGAKAEPPSWPPRLPPFLPSSYSAFLPPRRRVWTQGRLGPADRLRTSFPPAPPLLPRFRREGKRNREGLRSAAPSPPPRWLLGLCCSGGAPGPRRRVMSALCDTPPPGCLGRHAGGGRDRTGLAWPPARRASPAGLLGSAWPGEVAR